eukprot:scaffold1584_cov224-Chaetoceros_neogracile.AAC.3
MKLLLTTTLYVTAQIIVAQAVLICHELSDSAEKFAIAGFMIDKPCTWAANRDTKYRCSEYPEVAKNCQITCEVPCENESPSGVPSSSSSPSISPSLSPTAQILCDDRVDSAERFHVPGTQANEMRACEWAARADTTFRCSPEVVKRKCPVTCDLPCNEVVEDPKEDSEEDPTSFGQLNTGTETREEKTFPYTAVFVSLGALGFLGLLAYLTQMKDKIPRLYSDKETGQHNLNPLEFDKTDDDVNEGYNKAFCGWGIGAEQAAHEITYIKDKAEV